VWVAGLWWLWVRCVWVLSVFGQFEMNLDFPSLSGCEMDRGRRNWGRISDVSFSIRRRSLLASERLTGTERETKSAYLRGL